MIVLRLLGWLLLLAALAVAVHDGLAIVQDGQWRLLAAGELWFDIDPASLNLAQAAVERHIDPAAWGRFIRPVLLAPALLVLGLPGLLLVVLARRRRPRRARRFR